MHQTGEERIDCRISGRVQGVGFRWWTIDHARRLGVRGTVRNRPDGSVEVRAAGPPTVLEEFTDLLRQGPPHAKVIGLTRIPPEGRLAAGFRAEY